jgi:hypothetical protein
MSATNDFLAASQTYAKTFTKGGKPMPPAKKVAVVACMDARIETGRFRPEADKFKWPELPGSEMHANWQG